MSLYVRSIACVLRNGATPVATAPAVQRLEIPQDSDATLLLSVVDEAGTAVDITNFPITFTVKASPTAAAVVSRLAVVTSGPGGQATVSLAQADTAFTAGSYYYDIQLEALDGQRTQVVPYSPLSLLPSLGRVGAPVDSLTPSAVVAYGLPALAGNSGRVLGTNGTGLSWVISSGGPGGSAHIIQSNGISQTDRSNLNFNDPLVASDDALNDQTDVSLSTTGPGATTTGGGGLFIASVTTDAFGRVAGLTTGAPLGGYSTVKNSSGGSLTQRSNLKFDGGFSVADATPDTVVTLQSVGTAGTYSSVTTDGFGRVTAGSNPGYLTSAFYQTVKDNAGSVATQRPVLKFDGGFAVSDVLSETVVALTTTGVSASTYTSVTVGTDGRITAGSNPSVYTTIKDSTGVALTARASLKFNGDFSVTDATPDTVVALAAVGPGAVTTGGGALYINAITTDAQGRITALTTGTPASGSSGYSTVQANGTGLTQRTTLNVLPRLTAADDGVGKTTLDLTSGVVTTGTYSSVTVDTYGRVTAGSNPGFLTSAFYQTAQANGVDLTQRAKLNVLPRLTAADNGTLTTLDLTSGVVSTGTYSSVTVDTYGRVTAGSNPGYLTAAYVTIKDSTGAAATARSSVKFGSAFTVTDTAPDTVVTLSDTGVSASTYTSVTVDAKGRVTAGSNPGFLTSAFYQTIKNSAGTASTQRSVLKFDAGFTLADVGSETVVSLAGGGGGGSGTVTSITAGTGLSASPSSPITTSGTLSVDQAFTPTWTGAHTFSANRTWGTDNTYTDGDATHRSAGVFTTAVNSGASQLLVKSTLNNGTTPGIVFDVDGTTDFSGGTNASILFKNGGVAVLGLVPNAGDVCYQKFYRMDTGAEVGWVSWSSSTLAFQHTALIKFFQHHQPSATNTYLSGDSGAVWKQTWSQQYCGVQQNVTVSAAAALTINPTSGEVVRILLNASPTTVTLSAGQPRQILRIEWVQDGTGGRSLPSSANMTNFKLGATGTGLTSTANKRDIWTMMYDATDALWYEVGRVQNL